MTMQEAYVSHPGSMSEETLEYMKKQEPFRGKQKELDCYKKCVDDAWDLKDEKICSSVCHF
jgi:hypothetical protein